MGVRRACVPAGDAAISRLPPSRTRYVVYHPVGGVLTRAMRFRFPHYARELEAEEP